jgi:polysaccharide export outer membrane protein
MLIGSSDAPFDRGNTSCFPTIQSTDGAQRDKGGFRVGRFKVSSLLLMMAMLVVSTAGRAQQEIPAGGVKAEPPTALQDFDAGTDQEYVLGRGDVVQVDVVGRPELSGKHIIGPDGRITVPFIGSLRLADRTREEAAGDIRTALSKFYENLTVVVGVELYSSNHVLVLGAVLRPGPIPFDEPPTLIDIIARAGVPIQGAGVIQGKPVAIPERCAIYRGTHTVIWIDLKKLVESGSPLAQLHLKRDDVVYVPSPGERYVSMFGEVLHPGMLELEEGTTLTQLLAEAGGIVSDRAGRFPNIQVIQTITGSVQVISYKEILEAKAPPVTLHPGDIIYVPQSKFDRVAVTLQKISPLVQIATVGTLVANP